MPRSIRRTCAALSAVCALGAPAAARAGGYDTPMLYSARHMGMGGAAIGYVNDPSAVFHNPAGLGHIEHGEVLGDFSLLVGGIHASPGVSARDIGSELTVAPFFLAGAGFRIQKLVTLGVAVYPVASAGATFNYGATRDHTELFFLEASPAIAVNVLPNLRLGLGYRITYVRLDRYQGQPDDTVNNPNLDFTLSGQNFLGFRAGAQWSALPWLEFGAVYRNPTTTKVSNSHGIALRQNFSDVATKFKLPTKLGVGSRADFDHFGLHGSLAVDIEYSLNSENKGYPVTGTEVGMAPATVTNVFEWSNSTTLRIGGEYRLWRNRLLDIDRLALRAGWVYDSKTANAEYPTPFGTPPGSTQVGTVGTGYNGGRWQANLAYAYRFGHGSVTAADVHAPGRRDCQFCGTDGNDDYSIHLSGIYVDGSYEF